VTFCLFLDREAITLRNIRNSKRAVLLTAVFVSAAIIYAFTPVLQQLSQWSVPSPFSLGSFLSSIPKKLIVAVVVFATSLVSLVYLLVHPRHIFMKSASWTSLILLGFMTIMTSYNWNDKGRRTDNFGLFCWDCPEHHYYQNAKNKYFFGFPREIPPYMSGNFSLLYDVYSTLDFMPLDPKRMDYFQNHYSFNIESTKAPNYFRIDFTTIPSASNLRWEDFDLKIKGKEHDIYERRGQVEKIFFANRLAIVPLDQLIPKTFNEPHSNTFYIAAEDAEYLKGRPWKDIPAQDGDVEYNNYTEFRQGFIKFNATTAHETFVLVPEMFQSGWQVKIDGNFIETFPASYLFIGFLLPAGQHVIEMTFIPPGLFLGALTSIFSILFLTLLFYRYKKIAPARVIH
jgi:hypothetical protein